MAIGPQEPQRYRCKPSTRLPALAQGALQVSHNRAFGWRPCTNHTARARDQHNVRTLPSVRRLCWLKISITPSETFLKPSRDGRNRSRHQCRQWLRSWLTFDRYTFIAPLTEHRGELFDRFIIIRWMADQGLELCDRVNPLRGREFLKGRGFRLLWREFPLFYLHTLIISVAKTKPIRLQLR